MAISIKDLFESFLASPKSKFESTDYNECTLACRFAAYLSDMLPDYHVECGRNVGYFGLKEKDFCKRDIDIVIYKRDVGKKISEKYAIEVKCPTEGGKGITHRMEEMLRDIAFKEELLTKGGFDAAKCIAMTDDGKFMSHPAPRGRKIAIENEEMYEIFRNGAILQGPVNGVMINKPVEIKWVYIEGTNYWYYII